MKKDHENTNFQNECGGKKRKIFFSLSPINSRKKGRKEGELFYPRRYIAASGELLAKTRGRYRSRFFLRITKMRMIFKFREM